jgi:hypothetical protein
MLCRTCAYLASIQTEFLRCKLTERQTDTEAALTETNRRPDQPLHTDRKELHERGFYDRLPYLKHSFSGIPFKIVPVYQRGI